MNNCPYYHEIFTTSQKFYCEILILEQNSRNHESFLPRKFGAIRYDRIAPSGQMGPVAQSITTTTPLLNGSVFDCFILTVMNDGLLFIIHYDIFISEML